MARKFNIRENGSLDFEAILAAAKRKHRKMRDTVREHELDKSPAAIIAARRDWEDWVHVNLDERNIRMAVDTFTGEPCGLFVFVAGQEY